MNLTMNTIDIVVSDMDTAIAFYGHLGLEFKVDAAYPEHAGCDLPGGLHLMLDTEPFRASTTPGWTRPVRRAAELPVLPGAHTGGRGRDVHRADRRRVCGGQGAMGRVLGNAVRDGARP
jgi:catechol 2,3-dioxygenase-like lactoylglutathione lyase family enzyme